MNILTKYEKDILDNFLIKHNINHEFNFENFNLYISVLFPTFRSEQIVQHEPDAYVDYVSELLEIE